MSVAYRRVASTPASRTTNAASGNRLRNASGTDVNRMAAAECFQTWASASAD